MKKTLRFLPEIKAENITYEDAKRHSELMKSPYFDFSNHVWFDPVGDTPLESIYEDTMDSIGPIEYLRIFAGNIGIEFTQPIHNLSPYNVKQIVRKIVRSAPDFPGETFLQ